MQGWILSVHGNLLIMVQVAVCFDLLHSGFAFVRVLNVHTPCQTTLGATETSVTDAEAVATAAAVFLLQLQASQSTSAQCDAQGQLQIRQEDLLSIFVTSTAEMPGMLFASLLVDFLGRKRC